MSSSAFWTRLARTALIRPRLGAAPLFRRSYVLLAAKPTNHVLLRSIPLITRTQSSAAAAHLPSKVDTSEDVDVEVTEDAEKLPEFASLKDTMDPRIIRALTQGPFNLTTMSVVQSQVLPLLPELANPHDPENSPENPRDLLVRAKTGTGKTLAFLIPAVEARLKSLDAQAAKATDESGLPPNKRLADGVRRKFATKHTGTVIISPTRELATQIAQEASKLVRHIDGFGIHLFVGGESKSMQLRDFRRNAHDLIVATPGRMKDILESSTDVAESISHTQTLVLDEADSLLDMGFQPDLLAIQEYMPKSPERQTFLFSATISKAIRDIARASLARQHKYINCVSADHSPVHAHIPQYHTVLPSAEHQIPHILRVIAHDQLANPGKSKSIVFLPTTKMTMLFAEILRSLATPVLPAGQHTTIYEIHSRKGMESRTRASNRFRNDTSGAAVLVTSDVSARGVDYPGVSRVIQVGIPSTGEQYVHRVGRTGRAGTQGRGDLVLLPWERGFVNHQLSEVPLKPLTAQDLTTELFELAKSHDEDPAAFFGGEVPMIRRGGAMQRSASRSFAPRSKQSGTPLFNPSLTPSLEGIPRAVTELVSTADQESISETFTSLLGYYVGRVHELGIRKSDILEGCKEWSTQAGGLSEVPSLSKAFLDKLGFGNMDAMDRVRRGGFREPRRNAFASRGRERFMEEGGGGGGGFGRGGGGGFGGERREFGGRGGDRDGGGFTRRREFGGDRDGAPFTGRREFGGRGGDRDGTPFTGRREFGGERREFGGERREFAGRGGDRDGASFTGKREFGGRGRDGEGGFGESGRTGRNGKQPQRWEGRGRVKDRNGGKSWDSGKKSGGDGGFKEHRNPF